MVLFQTRKNGACLIRMSELMMNSTSWLKVSQTFAEMFQQFKSLDYPNASKIRIEKQPVCNNSNQFHVLYIQLGENLQSVSVVKFCRSCCTVSRLHFAHTFHVCACNELLQPPQHDFVWKSHWNVRQSSEIQTKSTQCTTSNIITFNYGLC